MSNDRWRTVFSLGDTEGKPMRVLAAHHTPAITSNFQQAPIERLYRAAFPERAAVPIVDFEAGYRNPFAVPEPALEIEQASTEAPSTDEQLPPVIEPPSRDLGKEVCELVDPVTDYLSRFEVVDLSAFDERLSNLAPLATTELSLLNDERRAALAVPEVKEFDARKTALLAELHTWADSLHKFLDEHRSWRTESLRSEHGEVWKAAREQTAVVNGLAAEFRLSVGRSNKLKVTAGQARLLFEGHAESRPDLDQLPSQADLDAWEAEDARLKTFMEASARAVESEIEVQNGLRMQFQRESTKLSQLRQTERELRSKLSGEVTTVLGLNGGAEL